ncbi:MAG: hypothetical protein Q9175_002959 [Cornicularia normoerica]
MTIMRKNGKITTTTRAIKRDRRHARKSNERQTSGTISPKELTVFERHTANLRLQAFNYNAKQSRRWLRARVLGENRGFVTTGAGLQLQKHFEKTEYQMQHPGITDVVLTASAKWILLQLELEREAARDEQGHPERVQDWWAAPTMVGKKKREGKMMGKKQGATAAQSISAEGLRDQVGALALGGEELLEEGDGSFLEGE